MSRVSNFFVLLMFVGLGSLISNAPTNGFVVLYIMVAIILAICFSKDTRNK